MANARSPNYPAIGLQEAIERLRKIYEKEHTHKAPPEVVAKAMGYQGLNGKSMSILSALKKYELLDEVGKELKVSHAGLLILVDPPDSTERAEAIRRAAFAPALFSEIRKNYGDSVPSDDNLRSFLLKKGFLMSAVDLPIRSYRETISLVNALPREDNGALDDDEDQGHSMSIGREPNTVELAAEGVARSSGMAVPSIKKPISGQQVGAAIPVSPTCSMTIVADGEVTQDGLKRLVEYINLIKDWFPAQNSPAQ